jgi:hypothetical protein
MHTEVNLFEKPIGRIEEAWLPMARPTRID